MPDRKKYLYTSIDLNYGCNKDGFTDECYNCCAVRSVQRTSGQGGPAAELCKKVLYKEGKKTHFNGVLIPNPDWSKKLTGDRAQPKNYMCSYQTEIGLATVDQLKELFLAMYSHPKDNFTLLTKIPLVLFKSVSIAEESLKRIGIDIKKFKNLSIATSIGEDRYKYRLEQLKVFKGFRLSVFHKPLIGSFDIIDYKYINDIRIAKEKGIRARKCKKEWISNIVKQAKEQQVKVYIDK